MIEAEGKFMETWVGHAPVECLIDDEHEVKQLIPRFRKVIKHYFEETLTDEELIDFMRIHFDSKTYLDGQEFNQYLLGVWPLPKDTKIYIAYNKEYLDQLDFLSNAYGNKLSREQMDRAFEMRECYICWRDYLVNLFAT